MDGAVTELDLPGLGKVGNEAFVKSACCDSAGGKEMDRAHLYLLETGRFKEMHAGAKHLAYINDAASEVGRRYSWTVLILNGSTNLQPSISSSV